MCKFFGGPSADTKSGMHCNNVISLKCVSTRSLRHYTSRLVYKWFLFVYKTSYFIGIVGYVIMMATFMGLYLFFGTKPHVWDGIQCYC